MLTKLFSWIGSFGVGIWDWIKGKFRLIIEYLLIAAVVSLAGFAFAGWLKQRDDEKTIGTLSTKVGQLSQSNDQLVATNAQQDLAIDQLKNLRKTDSDAIIGLKTQMASNFAKNKEIRDKLTQLEKNNVQAKALLDTTVPSSVGCLLDGTHCASAAGSDTDKD